MTKMAYRDFETAAFSRRSLLRGGAWLTAGAAAAGLPFSAAGQTQAAAASWPAVTALVDSYVRERKVANMIATLGWGTQDPAFIARGDLALRGGVRADGDSLYRIYSMTKPITGMAAMMLIDDGRLGLDQPLAEILPAFAEMQVQRTYDGSVTDLVPAERPITIRQLLTHTAGLGYSIVQSGPIKTLYERRGLVPGAVTNLPLLRDLFGRAQAVTSLETFADRLAEAPLVLQPGSKWSYSVALDLMGRVIEVASGQSFDSFLKDRIFEPCGMDSTWFQVPRSEIGRLTTNYGVMNGNLIPLDPAEVSVYLEQPSFPFGGAGLVSSPRDYDRFLQMLLGYGVIDGTRVMGELAVRVGTSNILPETATTEGTWIEGQGFGAGGRVFDGSYGWGGAAGTVAFVNYPAGLRANMMTQYMPSEAWPAQRAFPDAVIADLAAMQAAG